MNEFGAGIAPELCDRAGSRIANQDEVEKTIIILVTPGSGTVIAAGNPGVDVDKSVAGIAPNLGAVAKRSKDRSEQNVQSTVIVVIAPGNGPVINWWQSDAGVANESAAGVPPDLGKRI